MTRFRTAAAALAAAVLSLAASGSAHAGGLPPGFQDKTLFEGLQQPTAVTVALTARSS